MSILRYRKLTVGDYADALALYDELDQKTPALSGSWGEDRFAEVLHHDGTSIFGAVLDGKLVSMATLHILPNMTWEGRPYALIENVVTHYADQGQGYGRGVMTMAISAAWDAKAYKIMLLTGRQNDAGGFYQKCGFDADEKLGFVLRRKLEHDHID